MANFRGAYAALVTAEDVHKGIMQTQKPSNLYTKVFLYLPNELCYLQLWDVAPLLVLHEDKERLRDGAVNAAGNEEEMLNIACLNMSIKNQGDVF